MILYRKNLINSKIYLTIIFNLTKFKKYYNISHKKGCINTPLPSTVESTGPLWSITPLASRTL